jgi:hypothetical protein
MAAVRSAARLGSSGENEMCRRDSVWALPALPSPCALAGFPLYPSLCLDFHSTVCGTHFAIAPCEHCQPLNGAPPRGTSLQRYIPK